jgi:hypothetical protein
MEQLDTLVKAAELAASRAKNWRYAYSDNEVYDRVGLLGIAKVNDDENPIDEDSIYVVSPGGAIGFCEDGEDIDWLFLSGSGADEDLPATLQTASQINFCPQCGSAVVPGARFCGQCGKAL